MTPHEKAMWVLLRQGELAALNWRKQSVFGGYILDFVSHPARLVVEVDGSQHATADNVEQDAKRTAVLEQEGYRVLRFWNNEAVRERDGVWRAIYAAAEESPAAKRMQRWREKHMAEVREHNARLTSSSMEEVAAQRPEEVRPQSAKKAPHEAHSQQQRATPPLSALRADSSSIEEEQR